MAARSKRERKKRQLLRSLPFIPNRGLAIEYARVLRGLVVPMVNTVRREIVELYRRYAPELSLDADVSVAMDGVGDELADMLDDFRVHYRDEFALKGRMAAREMVAKQRENADRTFNERMAALLPLGASFGDDAHTMGVANAEKEITGTSPIAPTNFAFAKSRLVRSNDDTPEMLAVLSAAVIENESLIATIPAKFLDRAAGAATRAIQSGASAKALSKQLAKYGEMTLNHASRIALDQTFKTFTSINIRKFQAAGITKFEWLHTGGSMRPRPFHLAEAPAGLNHGIFDLADPPVIDPRTGERGFPGQLPFCRCTMCAVAEW